ncbi:ATP-binding protein [Psychrobacter sp. CCUG 69069]|jgi:predicted ATP-dependent protease|uniref:ATP-binding protein n=1 Tax=unclassified Psychrobacter TaxID=196806 RepID=UPI001E3F6C7E|nr:MULTISPECIES: ATP-binding protein [unclassified Psychrobacter]MCD1279317.1 ATP-binding protein [Psychrobacter sp. CCUG 69069]|tara:strand:+ start:20579 stop:23308 length:2730 start_codon:yes stop_codon:yes gene_type:complete
MATPISTLKDNQQASDTPHPVFTDVKQRCLITAEQLKRYSEPSELPTDTRTAPDLDVGFGQQRAIKALQTALDIKASGYHVFAAGENGLGKRTIISRLLNRIAADAPTPDDWVYVHNFTDPRTPLALRLPAGQAALLQQQINSLWQQAKKRLSQRFRSDQYQSKIEAIKNNTHEQESHAYEALNAEGKQYDLALTFRSFDNKAMFVHPSQLPTENNDHDGHSPKASDSHISESETSGRNKEGRPSTNDRPTDYGNREYEAELSNFAQKNHMQKRLSQLTIALEQLEDEANDAIEALHRSIARRALQPLFAPVYEQFSAHPLVIDYLKAVFADMVTHVERIVNGDDEEFVTAVLATTPSRYAVNVIVSHPPDSGAPVIFEDLPTHLNLLGHVEQITQLGTVTTDVSMIRAGALHRANGGYLLLEASHLLEHPYAWQGLKRALQSRKIKLSSLEQMLTLTGSLSLSPAPIDLDIKVILLGEADLYYELLELEPEFDAVFKVRADFHDDVIRTSEHELALVAKMADIIDYANLYPFDRHAQATLLEHLSLQAEEQDRLSLHSDLLIKLLHESNRHARLNDESIVTAEHVTQAINDMDERSGYLRDLYWDELKNGQQLIQTQGRAVGQVNALTVVSYADSEFGMPARLTAVIQPNIGAGEILDIERDVDLGGSLHAKGMLIMTSYLRALFSQHHALNFSASLAFEQSYAHIDGDSATVSEGCALLSALANVPIDQSFAITGSMNQLGEVQAVGGINAKIAGFFDACREQELTGQQGVVIPMANVKQLMLRDDIIDAVNAGSFHIYGVHTLSEALSLMTGLPIDTMNKKGRYRKDTLFGKVLSRLMLWDENQNEEDDIDDKKSKKEDKKKRKAKRQKKEDKSRKDKRQDEKNNSEVTSNGAHDDEQNIDNDEVK